MAKPGGSATANGILYQMLGTLGKAAEIAIRALPAGDDIEAATLVVEPLGGGGDLQLITGTGRVVEQWKARTGGGPWSLTAVINDVLPDLYRAVDSETTSSYRFMTGGRIGTWDVALTFFRSLGEPPAGLNVLDRLDDTTPRPFARGVRLTDRRLFLRVVAAVQQRKQACSEPIEEVYRKTWHLLSRFEVRAGLDADNLARQINEKLRAVVEHVEDVDAKRLELCARVLVLAGQGDVRIRAEDMLRDAGLSPASFLGWHALREGLQKRLGQRLERTGFAIEQDVRPVSSMGSDRPVTFFSGDSGQGKTWSLASLASSASGGPGLAVWVPSIRGGERADQIAADETWRIGLGRDGSLPLESVSRRRAETNPSSPIPWGLICVDGVHSRQEAEHLAGLEWENWGLRLALSGPPDVARHLRGRFSKRVHPVEVTDFTPIQLREYLTRRGLVWADTPPDVRDVIRRPLLARLYGDLAQGPAWTPLHEYELMEAYWRRIHAHGRGEPNDLALVRSLASRMLTEHPVYPWPPELLIQSAVTPDALQRLKESGWLRESGDGAAEMWHDRLLCWAVAESIANRWQMHELSTGAVASTLSSLQARTDTWALRLGYVLLDTVWLITDPGLPASAAADAWQLLAALESRGGHSSETRHLYERLLPTLGQRIVPTVVERLLHTEEDRHSPYPRLAAAALRAVARREPDVVRQQVARCLHDGNVRLQELALHLLPHLPDARHTERAWALHSRLAATEGLARAENHRRYQVSFEAVAACLQQDPAWIGAKMSAPGTDPSLLPELAHLLAKSRGPVASAVWIRSKDRLFDLIPAAKRRCLLHCIRRFRDHPELDRVAEWAASTEEFVAPFALLVLALFEPSRAVAAIGRTPIDRLWTLTGSLSDVLATLAPEPLCQEVQRLSTERPECADRYLDLAVAADQTDAPTVDAVITRLDGLLAEYMANPADETKRRLSRPLGRLEHLRGRAVLQALARQRGSSFEHRLAEVACLWTGNSSGFVDHEFESAQNILLKIGGDGLTRAVNALLASGNSHAQLAGCRSAPIRPDRQTRLLVADLANREELWGTGTAAFPLVQQQAINALAAMGEGAELMRAVIRWGTRISPDVPEVREGQGPLTDVEIRLALDLMADPASEQRAEAVLALGLSGRTDLRPQIKSLFVQSPAESTLALTSMLALESLGGRDPDLDERLLGQYRSGHHKFVAARLLATGDGGQSARLLSAALPTAAPYDEMDRRVIAYLGSQSDTRELVTSRLRELSGNPSAVAFVLGLDTAQLLDPNDTQDEHLLWDAASRRAGASRIHGAKAAAIARLAVVHPIAAFELAHQALLHDEDWDEMPQLLLDMDEERALPLLIECSIDRYSPRVCRLVALSLRRQAPQPRMAAELGARLCSKDWRARRVAAHMAGYCGAEVLCAELKRVALTDDQVEVCMTAASALRRQHREAEAAALVSVFAAAKGAEAWALAEDLIHLADPGALSEENDPLRFVTPMLSAPFALRRHLSESLRRRRKDIERDLDSLAARWESGV